MSTVSTTKSDGRAALWIGPALALIGIVATVVQFKMLKLVVPWYLPALSFLGAGIVATSLLRRRTIWRVLILVALLGLGGLETAGLTAMRLPPYTGPITVGKPFPAFEAKLADGISITEAHLAATGNTAFVFYRGRW